MLRPVPPLLRYAFASAAPDLGASRWPADGSLPPALERALFGTPGLPAEVLRFVLAHPALSGPCAAALRLLPPQAREDLAWVHAALPGVRRDLLLPAMEAEWSARAQRLLFAIDQAPDQAVWDHLVVGGGIVGAALAISLRGLPHAPRVLVLEAELGSTSFMEQGAAFHANTWSTGRPGPALSATGADLNPTLGPPVAMLSGALYPTGEVLAHSSLIGLYRSGADLLPHARVQRIEDARETDGDAAWPARFAVLFATRDGRERRVFCRSLTLTTGVGERKVDFPDPLSRSLVEEELRRLDTLDPEALERPLIAAADQVLRLAARSADALHPFRGTGAVCLAGGGSSAWTLLELARRLGPHAVYDQPGAVSRPIGAPIAPITWVTGDSGPASGREFRSRVEYRGRGDDVRPGTIEAVFAERYAQLHREVENAEQRGELELRRGRVVRVRLADDPEGRRPFRECERGRGLLVWYGNDPDPRRVDRLILATGYLYQVSQLLPALTSTTMEAPGLVPVHGHVPEEDGPAVLGLQVLDREGHPRPLYLCGIMLGKSGIPDARTSPIGVWVPKAVALARTYLAREPTGSCLTAPAAQPSTLQKIRAAATVRFPAPAIRLDAWPPAQPPSEMSLLSLPLDFALALTRFRFPGHAALRLSFQTLPDGALELSAEELAADDLRAVLEALSSFPRFFRQLTHYLAAGPIGFRIQVDADGATRTDSARMDLP